MEWNIQPQLETSQVVLQPLQACDFEALYAVAADPAIWEQHPNKDRWEKEVFRTFFEGAIESKGAFKIVDKETGALLGSTRFYDYNHEEQSIFIGYTFYAVACWGKGINIAVKTAMLDYIFRFARQVYFHIGAPNVRSQIAIGRIGARKTGEEEVAYFGEPSRLNFVYSLSKAEWEAFKNNK